MKTELKPLSEYAVLRKNLRKRLLEQGPNTLSDREVLKLILMTVLPRRDVTPLIDLLYHEYRSFSRILHADVKELLQSKSLPNCAISWLKVIEGACDTMLYPKEKSGTVLREWWQIIDYCRFNLSHQDREHLYLIFLDQEMRIITVDDFEKGSRIKVPVYQDELLKRCLNLNASWLIMVHNHPSGFSTPSQDDTSLTKEIEAYLPKGGVRLYDHLIVGNQVVYSIRENKIVFPEMHP